MFKLFRQKCSVCKMKLEDGKKYHEGFSKKFCSENCREEYRKEMVKEQSKSSKGCCH